MEITQEKTLSEQAKEEVQAERWEDSKEEVKNKYRELAAANKIVRNIEREIEDLLLEAELDV